MKNEVENLQELKREMQIEELNISNLLQNSWKFHNNSENFIVKQGNIVYVQLCVSSGTTTEILALPEEYRPQKAVFYAINTEDGIAKYGNINTDGKLYVHSTIVGKLVFMNFNYRI